MWVHGYYCAGIDNKTCKQVYFGMRLVYGGGGLGLDGGKRSRVC